MTNEEAINALQVMQNVYEMEGLAEAREAIVIARKALERRIPKKPANGRKLAGAKCACGASIFMHMKYCDSCGQAIDWSDGL